jgi:hypothetical protein
VERLVYLEAMYGFGRDQEHIAVPAKAEAKLKEMGIKLVGKDDLIAIYIPEGTDDVYEVGTTRGRVVGAVKLVPMPRDKTIHDYYFKDFVTQERRWPIGWPCKVVFAPPDDQCPVLRTLVELHHGPGNFQPYVGRLQYGPIDLDAKMAKALLAKLSPYRVA